MSGILAEMFNVAKNINELYEILERVKVLNSQSISQILTDWSNSEQNPTIRQGVLDCLDKCDKCTLELFLKKPENKTAFQSYCWQQSEDIRKKYYSDKENAEIKVKFDEAIATLYDHMIRDPKTVITVISSIKTTSEDTNREVHDLSHKLNAIIESGKKCSEFIGKSNLEQSERLSLRHDVLKEELWNASQRSFIASRREGGRFHSLNIIEHLLPQGRISQKCFASRGQTDNGKEAPLTELCANSKSNIAIIGDGGIGKTTFLQQIMEEEFFLSDGTVRSYAEQRPIPFYIELNRCPDHVGDWYDDALRKTNFITRYIGQIKENHATLDYVSSATLTELEKELQKIPADGQSEYLLLLDGFNEVRTSNGIRSYLSREISALHQYPNVRIITTSRETQAANFALEFENIKLTGVKKDDIIRYLRDSGIAEAVIGEINKNASLMKCLRIPLYLCMFTVERELTTDLLPETAGEILYCFFHRNSAFYNARRRIAEIRTVELNDKQVAFVLDFILPYIGWVFEESDTFSMNAEAFEATIADALQNAKALFASSRFNPFLEFDYSGYVLAKTAESFYDQNGLLNITDIVSCIYDYLGIMYRDQVSQGPYAERIRYAFVHHHFRDYFSAMWNVRLLSMLQCISAESFFKYADTYSNKSFGYFLDEQYWQIQKVGFISEILMEHRNRPQLDEISQNWFLPKVQYDEQHVLSDALDYCRKLHKAEIKTKHILQNILAVILYGRKEYSGLYLGGLDLRGCCLFNVICSRRGNTKTLAANFECSVLSHRNFEPEEHRDNVIEYVYHGRQCFTIDDGGIIKCWDVLSGRLEYELESVNPLGATDFSRKGFFKISRDGHWLAVKAYELCDGGTTVYVQVFNLTNPCSPPKWIRPTAKHSLLTFFEFTEDSKNILMLCDRKVLYCVDIETSDLCYDMSLDLYKQSELYSDSAESDIFIYTAEYDNYETDRALMLSWINEKDDDDDDDEGEDWDCSEDEGEDNPSGIILCELRTVNPSDKAIRTLYVFTGKPGTPPTISFIADEKCFLLYNYEENLIEWFDCISEQSKPVLRDLTEDQDTPPTEIYPHAGHKGEYFIMYPNICFVADIHSGNDDILMTYSISNVEKLIPDSDETGELEFKTVTAPAMNRFIVGNDTNTYEWDTVNDTVIRKYSSVFYGCTAFFLDTTRERCILVHRHNGVSFFGGEPIGLLNQHCFHEPGYVVDISCFDETHGVLALCFARPDHEKVVIMDISTGQEHTVFSSLHPGETIETLCFSDDGNRLLITTQYRCLECDLLKAADTLEVAVSGDNERFAAGNYREDEIEIAVVEHSEYAKPHIEPHCVYYRRTMKNGVISFHRTWFYLMPELEADQFPFFIHQDGDLGVGAANNSSGFQTYWVTGGFFLEPLPELERFYKPVCYRWQADQRLPVEKVFQPLDEIFVWHRKEIANRYHLGDSGFSYMYLADNRSDAIITEDRRCLFYQNDLQDLTYQKLRNAFQGNFENVHRDTYWSHAVPWQDGSLIGCYEEYNLIRITASDNRLLEPIEYVPGFSIYGCHFRGISADEEERNVISANCGIL